jgi:ADP-heptose:LPS heptosyltransferase
MHWNAGHEDEVARFLKQHKLVKDHPLICLHPGAKDQFKQWPAECFIELGQRLQEHLGATILITGNKGEKKLASSIAKKIPGAIPITNKLSLPALARLMCDFSLMITNDTGPMHLSFSVSCPTIALFSPTDPALCGPYLASKHRVISAPPSCTPCLKKQCQDPFCLMQIPVSKVYKEALHLYYAR